MKNNSKRRSGFTLIEVIISMALIAILSAGVYNAYLLLITQTKEGQVKQESVLIGKQVIEDIKSVSEKKQFNDWEENGDILNITDKLKLAKHGDNYEGKLIFDEYGNVTEIDSRQRYEVSIEMTPKNTIKPDENESSDESGGKQIIINKISDLEDVKKVYSNSEDGSIKLTEIEQEKSAEILHEISIKINIDKEGNLKIEDKDTAQLLLEYATTKDIMQLNLDLQYCMEKVNIEVKNETNKKFNLYILNSRYIQNYNNKSVRNVSVTNKAGILNVRYYSESRNKTGKLYDINIKVIYKVNNNPKLFESTFVQNMNIK